MRGARALTLLSVLWLGCRVEPPAVEEVAYSSPEEVAQAIKDFETAPAPAEPIVCVPPDIITHGNRQRMRVALTFDACSTHQNDYDARVTATLQREHAPATIFLGGAWSLKHPDVVAELAKDPLFELGNHAFTHPHLVRLRDPKRVTDELLRTQRTLFDLTGKLPLYFRAPYAEVNPRVAQAAADAGLITVQYDIASGDPDRRATKQRLIDWVLRKVRPGSVLVMHLNHRKFHTAEALPDIIRGLRARGYELVTMSTLVQDPEPVCRDESEPPQHLAAVMGRDAASTKSAP